MEKDQLKKKLDDIEEEFEKKKRNLNDIKNDGLNKEIA